MHAITVIWIFSWELFDNKNTRGCERLEEDDPNMRLQTEAKTKKLTFIKVKAEGTKIQNNMGQ